MKLSRPILLALLLAFLFAFLFATLYRTANVGAPSTLYVDNGHIYTAQGERFVMRGFNEMFVWSEDVRGEKLLPEIAQSGANTVRLVWSLRHPNNQDLIALIENTIAHKMVAVPECHDATGKWGKALQQCVDFWLQPSLLTVVENNKKWTIVNIANEAGSHDVTDKMFVQTYKAAISKLRRYGYTVPIMIDASQWGQHVSQLLRTGPALLAHDPQHNLIFSTHSYWPAKQSMANYAKAAVDAKKLGLTMIIGEGPSVTRTGQCDNPTPLPYLEGMKLLQEHNTGWLNWSWGGRKNGDCDNFLYFDITQGGRFGHWSHTPGANIVALSPYSIAKTSIRPASFYEDGKVKVSGIYLHINTTQLSVGESARYEVIVTPVNAHNKHFSIALSGDKNAIAIDKAKGSLSALRQGAVTLTATTQDGNFSWSQKLIVTGQLEKGRPSN